MKGKNVKALAVCLLTICLSLSCFAQKERVEISKVYISGIRVPMQQLPSKMADIYYNMYEETLEFDSCVFYKQEDGVRMLVSYAHREDTVIRFTVLAECQGDASILEAQPSITCTCEGTCTSGCNPEYLTKTGEWICTDCKRYSSPTPICKKTVTVVSGPDNPIKSSQSPVTIAYKKQCIPMENVPAVMTEIYNQERGKKFTLDVNEMMLQENAKVESNTILDVCEVVFQEDGHVLMVAHGQEDSLNVHFAIPMTLKNDCYQIDEKPTTTCTCYGECQRGCSPVYKGGYEWECTECAYPENIETTCIKKVTARLPEGGNQR